MLYYIKVKFFISVLDICYLKDDIGIEVVFVGCFNVGKFSVLNILIC